MLKTWQPAIHAAHFLATMKANPDLFAYVSFPTMETEADFMNSFYNNIKTSTEDCLFAIYDKQTAPETANTSANYAGIISLTAVNPVHAVAELGVVIFPEYQRTHVATNAIGLMLFWTLDPPSRGGLGLRRVEWQTHAANMASRNAALRMGFELEGIARWQRVFVGGKIALPVDELEKRNGTKGEVPGRHTAIFSIVWDEWEDKRPQIVAVMERKR
jgi:RimJ/RimL family protein N-acetyltransferase